MTAPPLASTSPNGDRVYTWQGRTVPSVTAILSGGIPKPFLPRWAAKAAATYAVDNRARLAELPEDLAVAEIKRSPWASRDGAASLGGTVHTLINARLSHATVLPSLPEGVRATQVRPYLAAFDQFEQDFAPRWVASEATVFNLAHGYAGTLDALAAFDGSMWVLDIKTGRRVYPEAALQLAAYAGAEFIAHPDGTTQSFAHEGGDLAPVTAAGVLHLQADATYELLPVDLDNEWLLWAVLSARDVHAWATEHAPRALGPPVAPPPRHLLRGDRS